MRRLTIIARHSEPQIFQPVFAAVAAGIATRPLARRAGWRLRESLRREGHEVNHKRLFRLYRAGWLHGQAALACGQPDERRRVG